MLMDYFLHNRLSGRCVSAIWTGICKIDSIAFRTDFLFLPGFHSAVRAEAAVKLISAVFADMKKNIRSAGGAILCRVIDLRSAEFTGFHGGFLLV